MSIELREYVKQINNLVLWYKVHHSGEIPSPGWIVEAVEYNHPAMRAETDPGEQVGDPSWWRTLGELQVQRAEQLEKILASRREKTG